MNELCVPGPGTRSGGQANQAQAPRKWLGVGKTNEEGAGGGVGVGGTPAALPSKDPPKQPFFRTLLSTVYARGDAAWSFVLVVGQFPTRLT